MEQWSKVLYVYGPFALLVFFVFVIEGRARRARQDGRPPRWVTDGIYSLTWVAIFAIAGMASYVWLLLNVSQEPTIRGSLEGLSASETMTSPANLYLRRIYTQENHFDFDWRIITARRLDDGEKISFYFDRGIKNGPSATRHELVARSSFYSKPVRIVYHPHSDTLALVSDNGREEPLPALQDVAAERPTTSLWPVWQVHAESLPLWESLRQELESPDPIIRSGARTRLAQLGRAALPFAEKVLPDPASSYRLRFGVLAALNAAPNLGGTPLSKSAYDGLARLAGDSDPTLRVEAIRFLKRYPPQGAR